MTADDAEIAPGYDVASAEPGTPHAPKGEWYCDNSECTVREVRVRLKLYGEPMPEPMACPACAATLKFHHWLTHKTLLIASGKDDALAQAEAAMRAALPYVAVVGGPPNQTEQLLTDALDTIAKARGE